MYLWCLDKDLVPQVGNLHSEGSKWTVQNKVKAL